MTQLICVFVIYLFYKLLIYMYVITMFKYIICFHYLIKYNTFKKNVSFINWEVKKVHNSVKANIARIAKVIPQLVWNQSGLSEAIGGLKWFNKMKKFFLLCLYTCKITKNALLICMMLWWKSPMYMTFDTLPYLVISCCSLLHSYQLLPDPISKTLKNFN